MRVIHVFIKQLLRGLQSNVSDPHRLYVDPDPAFKMNAAHANPDQNPDSTLKTKSFPKTN
jgi:hypothetical protein